MCVCVERLKVALLQSYNNMLKALSVYSLHKYCRRRAFSLHGAATKADAQIAFFAVNLTEGMQEHSTTITLKQTSFLIKEEEKRYHHKSFRMPFSPYRATT